MDDGTAALLKQQIAEYKTYRDIITQAQRDAALGAGAGRFRELGSAAGSD